MAAELVPITHFPIAEGLPPVVDAERIMVNATLLGRAASLGCFGDVELNWHADMPTTTDNVGFGGIAGDGMAFAAAAGQATRQPLGKYTYDAEPIDFNRALAGHARPPLKISVDIPQMQDSMHKVRDTDEWSRRINHEASEQVRAASRAHLLGSRISTAEGIAYVGLTTMVATATGALGAYANPEGFYNGLHTMSATKIALFTAAWIVVLNKGKIITSMHNQETGHSNAIPPKDTCFSLIPGWHLDRYLGVEALTRARRIIRPMPKPKK